MKIDTKTLLSEKVTILNKIKGSDSATGLDVWYKTTLNNCVWQSQSVAEQNGTQTNLGATYSIQVPSKSNKGYLPYHKWIDNADSNWTIALGDYVVLGEVEEDITPSNIVSVIAKHTACKVRAFEDLTFQGAIKSHGFLEQYASIYHIEGV